MLKSELQQKAIEFLGSKRVSKVYAIIDGTHMMLNEFEVRYLQAQCALAPNFEEFTRRVIIYNGPSNKYEKMVWKSNGQFVDKFIGNFFSASGEMHMVLLRVDRGISTSDSFNLY